MFNTKELTFIGLMGALMFVLSFLFGSALNIATGNPAASGFVTQIIQGIILTVAMLTVKKFGTATYMWVIYGILAIPTNMFGGFPGIYKVGLTIVLGLILDTSMYFFRYKKFGLIIGGFVAYVFLIPITIFLYRLLSIPGSDKLIEYWYIIFVIFFAEFLFGVFIGNRIFARLKNKHTIKLVMNNK